MTANRISKLGAVLIVLGLAALVPTCLVQAQVAQYKELSTTDAALVQGSMEPTILQADPILCPLGGHGCECVPMKLRHRCAAQEDDPNVSAYCTTVCNQQLICPVDTCITCSIADAQLTNVCGTAWFYQSCTVILGGEPRDCGRKVEGNCGVPSTCGVWGQPCNAYCWPTGIFAQDPPQDCDDITEECTDI